MGSAVSKNSTRSLPKSAPTSAIKRTDNADQLNRIRHRLNGQRQPQPEQAPNRLSHAEMDTASHDFSHSRDANKTVSDFISKKLSNISVERELLKLNPNHSSLKRLSSRKQLEQDYKRLIESTTSSSLLTMVESSVLFKLLANINHTSFADAKKLYQISEPTYQRILALSKAVSTPKVKISSTKSVQSAESHIQDDMNIHGGSETDTGGPINELNHAFSNILQGSQTGYDINNDSLNDRIHNDRKAHEKLNIQVKKTFAH